MEEESLTKLVLMLAMIFNYHYMETIYICFIIKHYVSIYLAY
jgi:hypothetical protein